MNGQPKNLGALIAITSAVVGATGVAAAILFVNELAYMALGAATIALCIGGVTINLIIMLPNHRP